ncbi:MAG TPA: hypothetical protein DCP69_11795 [Candidatus Omnitrophica bacterium]|nr:hypothetical protein [Candidatus Omnitrophota bacterium]
MPLTDEEKAQLDQLLGTSQPTPQSIPGTLPPEIAGVAYPASFTKGGLRVNIPPPVSEMQRQLQQQESKTRLAEESTARRQLLRKAADQKLQLEQGIALFNKIFDEAETDIPVIERPADVSRGMLPGQRLGRLVGRELGLREKQRGTLSSLRARATPSLKSLGEVGVLTNQDIDRILKGGFPADDDTTISRQEKREGLVTDLQMKLNSVNEALGQVGTRQTDQGRLEDPYVAEARRRGLLK